MKVLERKQEPRTRTVGRLSDGSDRQEIVTTAWVVVTDIGQFEFDHDPSDDELMVAPPRKQRLAPTAAAGKAALRGLLDDQVMGAQAWNWFAAKAATDSGLSQVAKDAIVAIAAAEYTETKRLLQAWRQAT